MRHAQIVLLGGRGHHHAGHRHHGGLHGYSNSGISLRIGGAGVGFYSRPYGTYYGYRGPGYYAAPNAQTGGSTLYYVVQADPKGQLPMWVVNLVAPDQAQNVARLRDHLDGVESPEKKK